MSYVPDAEKKADIGDYRYFVTRLDQKVTVTRHLLSGKKLDPSAKKEEVSAAEVPAQLVQAYRQLKAGNLPVVA